jgi:hypothetical protein
VQCIEGDVFFEVIGKAAQVCQNPGYLFLLREKMRWEEAAQAKCIAFLFRKRSAL